MKAGSIDVSCVKESCLCKCVCAVPVYVVRWSTESCNGSTDRRKRRQHCHVSEITDYPRIKKTDDHLASSLLLTLKRPLLVTGDVIIEFFNKPKMMKKVLLDSFMIRCSVASVKASSCCSKSYWLMYRGLSVHLSHSCDL